MKTPFTLKTERADTVKVFHTSEGISLGLTYEGSPTVTMSGASLTLAEAEQVHKALGTAMAGYRAFKAKP